MIFLIRKCNSDDALICCSADFSGNQYGFEFWDSVLIIWLFPCSRMTEDFSFTDGDFTGDTSSACICLCTDFGSRSNLVGNSDWMGTCRCDWCCVILEVRA